MRRRDPESPGLFFEQFFERVFGLGHDAVRKRYSRALAELGRLLRERIG